MLRTVFGTAAGSRLHRQVLSRQREVPARSFHRAVAERVLVRKEA
jgi:hypothetical protein